MHGMQAQPSVVMSFVTLDEAESALDWIGLDFVEAGNGFEGRLTDDDRELLDEVLADPEAPGPVRELAARLGTLLDASGRAGGAGWRVAFEA